MVTIREGMFKVSSPNVIIDCIKRAEDSNDIVVRVYEAYGGRGQITLSTTLPVKSAQLVNTLEEKLSDLSVKANSQVTFDITPFKVITINFRAPHVFFCC